MWVIVKIMVPFIIIGTQKGTMILTIPHVVYCRASLRSLAGHGIVNTEILDPKGPAYVLSPQ